MSDASSSSHQQPIIIKRKSKSHGGAHGGAWKVAYADFVTAMMALFIVLWLLSSSEQVKKAVAGYFTDPNGKGKNVGSGLVGSGESMALSNKDLDLIKQKLEEALRKVPDFQKLKDHVTITVTGEGLRVELSESDKGVFFESGNARPTKIAIETISVLAGQVGQMPNSVVIEGHTDATPYDGTKDYSNWELSTDRANEARRIMQTHGIRADQVKQVRGFADQNLRTKEKPSDASNRRISFIVQYDAVFADALRAGKDAEGAKPATEQKKASGGKDAASNQPAPAKPNDLKSESHPAPTHAATAAPSSANPEKLISKAIQNH